MSAARTAPASRIQWFEPSWSQPVRGVVAVQSLRHGGVSEDPYSSLNLGFTTGDDIDRVRANRARLARAAGFSLERAFLPALEHGAAVIRVREGAAGAGSMAPDPEAVADGLVTIAPNLPLMVTTADCVAVFFAERRGRGVALAHAGWRGVLAGVAERTLESLVTALDGRTEDVAFAFGPSIGPCCFEVDGRVAERFADTSRAVRAESGERHFVDLCAALHARLERCGLPGGTAPRPPCTRCHCADYFSHRSTSGRPTGRSLAVIWRTSGR